MKITKEKLVKLNACKSGIGWFEQQDNHDLFVLLDRAVECNHFDWANWMITKLLNHTGLVQYAIFAAELSIHFYTDKFPDDDRPQKAIEAAKEYLNNPPVHAAIYAADAADSAADSAYGADTRSANNAAYAAVHTARAVCAESGDSAYAAACDAYVAACTKSHHDGINTAIKIINYGKELISSSTRA